MVKTGDHVLYRGSDYKGPATVLHARARDGKDPLVTLAFVDPKRTDVLGQPNWRNAFDRRFDIESETDAPAGQAHYSVTDADAIADELEQTRVQLAGCSVAALGWSRYGQEAKPGDYGYSASYQDVLDLRVKYEALLASTPKITTIGQEIPELPSAADLDAVAAEQKVVEETQ